MLTSLHELTILHGKISVGVEVKIGESWTGDASTDRSIGFCDDEVILRGI